MKHYSNALKALLLSSLLGVSLIAIQDTYGAARTWGNTGTDYNTGTNWGGTAPGTGDVGLFDSAEVTQPNLSASLSNAGVFFKGAGSSGYDLTNTSAATLTLTGYSTSGSSGSSNSSAAALRNEITSGTNTIDVPLILAPASGSTSYFVQSGAGTLVVNGDISGSGIALSLRGGAGVIHLNGNNSFSGGALIDTSGETVVVGNDNALGSGTFTVNSTSTLQAGGGARTLANDVVLGGTATLSGSNAFTFNGAVSTSGANTRTLTVSNTGGATLGGPVTINGNSGSGILVVNGSSPVGIDGVVQDGAFGSSLLRYNGSSTLTLSNANTYTGGTQLTIAGGTIIGNHDHAFGTGDISLTAGSVTLTLQGGVSNDYIADSATLSLFDSTDVVNLNFAGTDTIGGLTIGGVMQLPGIYNSGNTTGFTGTGNLQVVPEPGTWLLLCLGAGLLGAVQRFRRKRV
jgi:fibronectin-binding autotransporter adhesin